MGQIGGRIEFAWRSTFGKAMAEGMKRDGRFLRNVTVSYRLEFVNRLLQTTNTTSDGLSHVMVPVPIILQWMICYSEPVIWKRSTPISRPNVKTKWILRQRRRHQQMFVDSVAMKNQIEWNSCRGTNGQTLRFPIYSNV